MPESANLDKYRAYLISQKDRAATQDGNQQPFITISRQAGAGAQEVLKLLTGRLNKTPAPDEQPWVVFDKNLISMVLEDQHLPQEIARNIQEDKDTTVQALVGELLGLHPSMWTIFHHTSDTILKLARIGRCVIVGRGGNIITTGLKQGLHIRLVAPDGIRIARLKSRLQLDHKAAEALMHEQDAGSRRYIKANFDRDIDDPLLYDAVLNTALLGTERTAAILADMVSAKGGLHHGIPAPVS